MVILKKKMTEGMTRKDAGQKMEIRDDLSPLVPYVEAPEEEGGGEAAN